MSKASREDRNDERSKIDKFNSGQLWDYIEELVGRQMAYAPIKESKATLGTLHANVFAAISLVFQRMMPNSSLESHSHKFYGYQDFLKKNLLVDNPSVYKSESTALLKLLDKPELQSSSKAEFLKNMIDCLLSSQFVLKEQALTSVFERILALINKRQSDVSPATVFGRTLDAKEKQDAKAKAEAASGDAKAVDTAAPALE